MINILHVISDTNIGGAGTHLVTLANTMDKNKFNVFVACPKDASIITLFNQDVNIIKMSSMKGDKSFDFGCINEIMKIIRKNNISIVHTHGSLSGRIAGKLCRRKVIFTKHTPSSNTKQNKITWMFNKYLNLFLCDRVISVSKYISEQLLQSGFPKDKVKTIYNGIDISLFDEKYDSAEIKKIYGISDEIVLLITARLEELKGHKYLLKAFHQLIRENYKLKLLVVGSGSQEEAIKDFIMSNSLERNIIMTGTIKDIRPITSIADIIVLPSLLEALGLALIEGMCMEKPCVASNVDGIPEVVSDGKSGILVPPKDIEKLKNALMELIENQDLRTSMGQEGKKIAFEKFSLDKMVTNIQNLYLEVIS